MTLIKTALRLGAAAAAVAAVHTSAMTIVVPLGVIVVPPTQTTSPGISFTKNGTNTGLYEFFISQPETIGAASFTNTAAGTKGVFTFTSIALYSGFGAVGTPLETGTIGARASGSMTAYLDPYLFGVGKYTFAYTGKTSGQPASVGSSITFASGTPEPAAWMLMVTGFGLVGFAARNRQRAVAA